eukprot:TRINITY_DN8148_c0_g1_i1.p1 TRINITY_DN8148_c0_g1~~TRINITY_DN8148_c0_g1_i1.p1  ORF type:complete len:104 (+),score=16.79 TRINITY_DN8148_c0_g1_i1:1427-1738(+)
MGCPCMMLNSSFFKWHTQTKFPNKLPNAPLGTAAETQTKLLMGFQSWGHPFSQFSDKLYQLILMCYIYMQEKPTALQEMPDDAVYSLWEKWTAVEFWQPPAAR